MQTKTKLGDPPSVRNEVLRRLTRVVITATGIVLMCLGARANLPLISLIGAVLILIWFYIWTREDT